MMTGALLNAGIILLVVVALALWWAFRRDRRRRQRLALWQAGSASLGRSWRLAVSCALLTAATLLLGSASVAVSGRPPDAAVVLVVDVSRSMLTPDIPPHRLSAALALLQQHVRSQPGRMFGVVAFAAEAMVACPLTPDTDAVTTALSQLSERPIVGGTAIASGVRVAAQMLRAASLAGTVVLVTDGEDFGESFDGLTEDLRAADIVLVTIGAATETGGHVPVDPAAGAATDSGGVSRLNVDLLTRLAEESGGVYMSLAAASKDLGLVSRTQAPEPAEPARGVLGLVLVALATVVLCAEAFSDVAGTARAQS